MDYLSKPSQFSSCQLHSTDSELSGWHKVQQGREWNPSVSVSRDQTCTRCSVPPKMLPSLSHLGLNCVLQWWPTSWCINLVSLCPSPRL